MANGQQEEIEHLIETNFPQRNFQAGFCVKFFNEAKRVEEKRDNR
ncbi:MAG: hypothetical protein ACE5OR_04750 [bacterium]